MTRQLLGADERTDGSELGCSISYFFRDQPLGSAMQNLEGPTFAPPVMEGQYCAFMLRRRGQSEPRLTVKCEAVRVNGQLQWAFLEIWCREERNSVDLFPNHRNTLNLK